MTKPKLYIDIDGVLLGKKEPGDYRVCLAGGAADFLRFALENFDCYWLTTHAREGDSGSALAALKLFADKTFMEMAKIVKPVAWKTLKTEAIDLKGDFYWLDDQLLQFEQEILKKAGRLDRWIKVDTRANFSDLAVARQLLTKLAQKI